MIAGCEHHHDGRLEVGLRSKLLCQLKSVHFGHLSVEQNKVERLCRLVGGAQYRQRRRSGVDDRGGLLGDYVDRVKVKTGLDWV